MFIEIVVGFLLATYYAIRYGFARPWRSSAVGASAWTFAVIVAVVLGLRVLRAFGVVFPEWLGPVSYFLIDAALAFIVITFARARRHRRGIVSDEREEVR